MSRIPALAVGLLLLASAFAAQTASAQQAQPILVASAPAAADRVYPPLPSLSMIPASVTSEDADSVEDEAPARPVQSRRGKKKVRVVEHRSPQPVARLVVSDETRAYLRNMEHQLDQQLAREPLASNR